MNVLTADIGRRVDLLDAKVDQLQERVSTFERLEQPPNERPRRHSADLEAIWNSPTYFASDIIDLAEVAEVVRRLWIRQQTSQQRLSRKEQVTLDAACRALSALAQLARPEDLSDAETPASVRKDE